MMESAIYLGMDVGSVSVNTVLMDRQGTILATDYRRSRGQVVSSIKSAAAWIGARLPKGFFFAGCGTTGSGRELAGALLRADLMKNEISAHAAGALLYCPEVRTILEIGGEDSKIILLEKGLPVDFAMNTICAAGTGAFLDQMAARLEVPIEKLGEMALQAKGRAKIAGRCTVFAESDVIFQQQTGIPLDDILNGICRSMVRNYLNDVGQGKSINPPVMFQGGVAANRGIVQALKDELNCEIIVPENYGVMGAIGVALLVRDFMEQSGRPTRIRPLNELVNVDFNASSFSCPHCGNHCEVTRFEENGHPTGYLGGRCDRWIAEGRYRVSQGRTL